MEANVHCSPQSGNRNLYASSWCREGGGLGCAAYQHQGGGEGYLGWTSVREGAFEGEVVINGQHDMNLLPLQYSGLSWLNHTHEFPPLQIRQDDSLLKCSVANDLNHSVGIFMFVTLHMIWMCFVRH